jgi:hypothetical protein
MGVIVRIFSGDEQIYFEIVEDYRGEAAASELIAPSGWTVSFWSSLRFTQNRIAPSGIEKLTIHGA